MALPPVFIVPLAMIHPQGADRMIIRPAREGDLPAVAAIEDDSPGAARWGESGYRGAVEANSTRQLIVAEHPSAAVIAFLLFDDLSGREADILNLAVAPAWRRAGIGSALLSWVAAQDFDRLLLEVRAANLPAQRLYERFGFQKIATRLKYYSEPCEDALVFEWRRHR